MVQSEIQERSKISEEISAVKNALQNAASMLDQDAGGKAGQLEVGSVSYSVETFGMYCLLCWGLNLLQMMSDEEHSPHQP